MIILAWSQLLSLTIITEECTMNDMRGEVSMAQFGTLLRYLEARGIMLQDGR
jgi:hypothetical protein